MAMFLAWANVIWTGLIDIILTLSMAVWPSFRTGGNIIDDLLNEQNDIDFLVCFCTA